MALITEFDDFVKVHELLLIATGLPRRLWESLFVKLSKDILDAGNFFSIEEISEGKERRLALKVPQLKESSEVFIIDHAWSFRLPQARQQLETVDGLAERMATLMGVADPPQYESEADDTPAELKAGSGDEHPVDVDTPSVEKVLEAAIQEAEAEGRPLQWLEFDDCPLNDEKLGALRLATGFPDLVGLSLWGTQVTSLEVLLEALTPLHSLRALWINGTPLDGSGEEVEATICAALPQLEVYNRRLTATYGPWSLGFCAGVYGPQKPQGDSADLRSLQALDLSERGLLLLKPQVFSAKILPCLAELNLSGNTLKLQTAGDAAILLQALPSLRSLQADFPGPLASSAVTMAEQVPRLLEVNGLSRAALQEHQGPTLRRRFLQWSPGEPLVERVLKAMWQFMMMYRLATDEQLDETPVWYVMDEVGSALRHSDMANMRTVPFLFMPDGSLASAVSYNLLWPVHTLEFGQEATRDYLPSVGEQQQRSARLSAWFLTPPDFFHNAYQERCQRLAAVHFAESQLFPGPPAMPLQIPPEGYLKVYSEIPHAHTFLSRPDFKFVEDPQEADIVWTATQIDEQWRQLVQLRPEQVVNQFPFEACVVMKHHLAATVQRAFGNRPWLPDTYNLETELAAVIGAFQEGEARGGSNRWIVKPWNMARSLDSCVATTLPQLVRLVETGPKIAQRYIEQPALFRGRKFDLRFLILVRSMRPLNALLAPVFWSRIANKAYSLEERSLADFETHFTVMNYTGKEYDHVLTHDFVEQFEREHKVEWKDVMAQVRVVLREVLLAAAAVHPEMQASRSRAMYGADIMLDHDMQPKLLELTYCPDCTRGCKFDMKAVVGPGRGSTWLRGKDLYNNIFGALFLGESNGMVPL